MGNEFKNGGGGGAVASLCVNILNNIKMYVWDTLSGVKLPNTKNKSNRETNAALQENKSSQDCGFLTKQR